MTEEQRAIVMDKLNQHISHDADLAQGNLSIRTMIDIIVVIVDEIVMFRETNPPSP